MPQGVPEWFWWGSVAIAIVLLYKYPHRPKNEEAEPEPQSEPEEVEPDEADLDVQIRTGLRDPAAIILLESLFREAGIPFFVMGQNAAARQESGNIAGWWEVRVPHKREAEARELIQTVVETR